MAKISIPAQVRPGLIAILSLSDATIDSLVSVLSTVRTPITSSGLSSRIVDQLSADQRPNVEEIINTLLSMYSLRRELESPLPDVVDDLSDAIKRSTNSELHEAGDDLQRVKNVLSRLLGIDYLDRVVKRLDLAQEHERIFTSARVLTDIRPVYGSDPTQPPAEAIISHTLKIMYLHEGEPKEIYIAMDDQDLAEVKTAVDRAIQKALSLQPILRKAEMSFAEDA